MNQGPLPSSFDGDTEFYEENRWQKLSRRLKEEPLIPLGCVLTCWALYGAAKSIRSGDSVTANQMFRKRLYAQAFTIIAMVGGSYYYKADRVRRKEFDNLVAERKAKEKNEKWIQELEARDREEKEWRAKLNLVSAGKMTSKEKQTPKQVVVENGQKSGGPVSKAVKELEG